MSAAAAALTLCLVVAIYLSHVVHVKRITALTEATVSLLVGLVAGGAVVAYFIGWEHGRLPPSLAEFNTEVCFDVLLPPIIFYAGFTVKRKLFFRNFTTLVLFGVVGTFITSGLIAAGCAHILPALGLSSGRTLSDSMSLGVIFTASDSVAALQILDADATPLVYSLVFGEGVVNDASSIVLLRAVQKISHVSQLTGDTLLLLVGNFARLFVLSLLLGAGMGLASAYLIRRAFVHHSTDREVALVALMGFLSFLAAEVLGLSGIFAILFCGITMSHYTWHSLSPTAKVVTVYVLRIAAFTCELFLFVFAGYSMWSSALWRRDPLEGRGVGELARDAGLLAAALVALVLVCRALTVVPLTLLANTWRPPGCRITTREAVVIWWAGAMRGAVTVAMAFKNFAAGGAGVHKGSGEAERDAQIIVVASNAAVIFITVVMGGMTAWLLKGVLTEESMVPQLSTLVSHPSMEADGVSAPLLARHLHWNKRSPMYAWWHKLDAAVLHPLFGGRPAQPGAHSPPHSPGRRIINQVLGPSLVRRLAPAQQPADKATDGGPETAGDSPPPPPPQCAPSALARQATAPARPPRHPDPFRLWPTPSETAAAAAGVSGEAHAGPGQARRPGAVTFAPLPDGAPLPRLASLRPEAREMQAASAVEELFSTRSARLDSACSQQVDWADSAEFGEAAFLAAGAPSDDLQSAASADPSAQDGSPQAGPPQLARRSPFQTAQPEDDSSASP
ncbi:sodium hydrogen exchanger 2-like [Micractinium conductrix]|uniref:Sodium hydrogen exchanger 2-like n=1 Tax=Micractinium conductrix TaxID=554055 RepID=A0A2P6VPJ7_9CHLO|nr:sodium hydrogen exchanger 2-like [Micractinium conductrix]|eukprot:PSC76023.1 sodium hydrogen exchanger 2-like [Micractinium conductrix]